LKEETIIQKLCDTLRSQGLEPSTEYAYKGIRADIVLKLTNKMIAIEVKASTGNPYHGLGQALSYLEFADESWLVLPARALRRLYPIVQRFRVPIKLLNTTDLKIVDIAPLTNEETKTRYSCLFCSESFPTRKWAISHLKRDHAFDLALYNADMNELGEYRQKEMIRRERAITLDELRST